MAEIDLEVTRTRDALTLAWHDRKGGGSCRFDRIPDAIPEWLGSADELLEGASRRQEGAILDAVARWAEAEGLELGLWHDDAGVDILTTPPERQTPT